ncbi:MAG: hypothetical protein IT221_08155 [Fluviicola sp.]|nr:hypothetical protein [Fluviicola sp.]
MKRSVLFLGIFLASMLSCTTSETTTVSESKTSVKTQESEVPTEKEEKEAEEETVVTSVELKGKFLRELDYGMREHLVILEVNGTPQTIDTIAACDPINKKSFAQYDIPASAKSAYGGWWAGYGEYYYATIENNKAVVYYGWQDEGQEDSGYHWEVKKLKNKQ